MINHFICPKCRSHLNVGEDLIFAAKSQDGRKGLILLHSELGNYKVRHNPHYDITAGMKFEFHCPVCHHPLATDINKNLSRVIMVDPGNKEYEVLFSKIAGEKSTYCLIGENVNMFGDDAGNYVDFVNLSYTK